MFSDFSAFALFTAGLACLTSVSAYTTPVGENPSGNPIYRPLKEIVPAGQPFTITWEPTVGDTVTLVLLRGPPENVVPLSPIVENIPNSGSYSWTPSTDLVPDTTRYGIQLIVDTPASLQGQYQYSTQFGISNPRYGELPLSSSASSAVSSTIISASSSASLSSVSTESSTTISSSSSDSSSISSTVSSSVSSESSSASSSVSSSTTTSSSYSSITMPTNATSSVPADPQYTTEVVTSYTTYCPTPTTLTVNSRTYTVSSATTLTITDCPCTVTNLVSSAATVATAVTDTTVISSPSYIAGSGNSASMTNGRPTASMSVPSSLRTTTTASRTGTSSPAVFTGAASKLGFGAGGLLAVAAVVAVL